MELDGSQGIKDVYNVMNFKQSRRWLKMDALNLVVVGCTGSGKSSLVNCILGESKCESRLSSKSVTIKYQMATRVLSGRLIRVIDTPGLFDTSLTESEVTKEMKNIISHFSPGPNALLFVARIGRFTDVSEILKNYIDILGDRVMEYTILVFTGLDALENEGVSICDYLDDSQPFLENHLRKHKYMAIDSRKLDSFTQQQLLREIEDLVQRNSGTYFTIDESESSLSQRRNYRPITVAKEERMNDIVKAWKNLLNTEIRLRKTKEQENTKQRIQSMVDGHIGKRTRSAHKSIEKLLQDNGIFDLLQYSELEKEILFGMWNKENQFIKRKFSESISREGTPTRQSVTKRACKLVTHNPSE